jgi:oligosaccharide repeat unit polymerase
MIQAIMVAFLMGLVIIEYHFIKKLLFTPLLLAFIWFAYASFHLLFNSDYLTFGPGIMILMYCIALVVLGGLFGSNLAEKFFKKNPHYIKKNETHYNYKGWIMLAYVSTILTFGGILFLVKYSFNEFQLFNSAISLLALPQQFATDRYGGAQYLPVYLKFLSYMIYPTAISIGALVGAGRWRNWTRMVPIVLALCYGVIYSSRTVVILTVVAMISSEWATRSWQKNNANQLKKLIFFILSAIIIFPIVFISLQWLRQGMDADFILGDLITVARSSMTGSISAFTQWYHQWNGLDLAWGRNSFAGPFELIGISERVQGFYLDFSEVGTTHINIYTAFRGILEDYGFLGATIFLFFFGFVSAWVFNFVENGWITFIPLLALLNGWILFSPFISLFVNNSIIAGYVIFQMFSFDFLNQKHQIDI